MQIISQEDFEQMVRIRRGMQVLLSKYRAAHRRLETLESKAEGLRKKKPAGDQTASDFDAEVRKELECCRAKFKATPRPRTAPPKILCPTT